MTPGSSSCPRGNTAGRASSAAALLRSNSSFKDPFAALAHCGDPWQELDVEAGASSEDGPLPEVQLSQLSIDNGDDTLISSADPAACDFLLVALAFHEQRKSLRSSLELILEDPLVTVAVGEKSTLEQQQDAAGSCKAVKAKGKVATGAAAAGCTATSSAK